MMTKSSSRAGASHSGLLSSSENVQKPMTSKQKVLASGTTVRRLCFC
jgi:hypothetical protein